MTDTPNAWIVLLAAALCLNAVLGFGYRVYRLAKGGPVGDVVGQAILGVILLSFAWAAWVEQPWARWAALAYAALFAVVVMPVWVLGVLIPLRPRAIDYAFAVAYWVLLVVIAVAALAA